MLCAVEAMERDKTGFLMERMNIRVCGGGMGKKDKDKKDEKKLDNIIFLFYDFSIYKIIKGFLLKKNYLLLIKLVH